MNNSNEVEALATRLRQAVQGCTLHSHGPVQAWAAVEDGVAAGVPRHEVCAAVVDACRRKLSDLRAGGVSEDDPRVRKERLTMRFARRLLRDVEDDGDVNHLDRLLSDVAPAQSEVMAAPIYTQLRSVVDVRRFMEIHVFAVWDFMCLLKSLQRVVTCIDTVWTPTGDPVVRRLVNEIVVGEESDEVDGVVWSHFEMYVAAMREIGADTGSITAFMAAVRSGSLVSTALERADAPEAARAFVMTTMEIVKRGRPNEIAAAFTLGREQPIPLMFRALVASLRDSGVPCSILLAYLDRHIEVDGEEHGPAALRLLSILCDDDPALWGEATAAAITALNARRALWDGISKVIG